MASGQHNVDPTTYVELLKWQGGGGALDASDLARYWAKVRLGPSCWEWTSNRTPLGYGQFHVGARRSAPQYAHRIAWALSHGSIPAGKHICHTCDNRGCVNPAHLFLGTHTDNMRDASAKGRLSVPRRRTRGFKQVAITRYLEGGVTLDELAADYGVHKMTICRWVSAATDGADQRAARHQRKAVA